MKKGKNSYFTTLNEDELTYQSDDNRFFVEFKQVEENIFKLKLKGYANLVCAIQNIFIFDKIIHYARNAGYNKQFYLVIDLHDLTGTNAKARQYYVKKIVEFFDDEELGWAALVSPGWTVRALGVLTTRLYKKAKLSYHQSDEEALQRIHQVIKQRKRSSSFSKKIEKTLLKENLADGKSIKINGYEFYVKTTPEWNVQAKTFSINVFTLNGYILLTRYKGVVNAEGLKHLSNILLSIITPTSKKSKLAPMYHVVDASGVNHMTHDAKKELDKLETELKKYFSHSYFILSNLGKTIYNLYKILKPQQMKNRSLAGSYYEAVVQIMGFKGHSVNSGEKVWQSFNIPRKNIRTATKNELLDIIDMQNEAMNALRKNQNQRINQLFEIIGRISWDESYTSQPININSEDPFYYLFGAVYMLQEDVVEMIRQLKQLNKTLEEKIEKRTEKLKEQNVELTKVNEELDRFFYIVAHDLKAPLASLMGLINLIRAEELSEANKPLEEYFDKMSRSIAKMEQFITDVTKYSRNKRLEIRPEKIDFKSVINNTLEDLYDINDKNIKIITDVRQKEPFYTDKIRLQIIMNNLISNAIRYSRETEEQSFIEIKVNIKDGMAEISVKDNGQGIDKEFQDKIFEMFFRASTEKSGSGLGLYIVKETVEKLRGTIDVESKRNIGSTFNINIPSLGD